ncbi:MAG: hypothetical protein HYY48_00795 [Gammaproteobacteria bacterium]|nr:hypothetical protein [Gammaproteobacteria bacterium]
MKSFRYNLWLELNGFDATVASLGADIPELQLYPIHTIQTLLLRSDLPAVSLARHALACMLICASGTALPGPADESWQNGVLLYKAQKFAEASVQFEQAVALTPESSAFHHWLGKSYGRTAERSPWFRAIRLARRTRREFETAVRLDDRNVDALRDLMEYYRRAPAFLGGSAKKAGAIEQRLRELQAAD